MHEGLAVLGFFTLVCLGGALVCWLIWVSVGVAYAFDNDNDLFRVKMDIRQSKEWSEIVDRRLNVIEKKLKIKKENT